MYNMASKWCFCPNFCYLTRPQQAAVCRLSSTFLTIIMHDYSFIPSHAQVLLITANVFLNHKFNLDLLVNYSALQSNLWLNEQRIQPNQNLGNGVINWNIKWRSDELDFLIQIKAHGRCKWGQKITLFWLPGESGRFFLAEVEPFSFRSSAVCITEQRIQLQWLKSYQVLLGLFSCCCITDLMFQVGTDWGITGKLWYNRHHWLAWQNM